MARLQNVATGVFVSVADEKVARLGAEWVPADGSRRTPKSETPDSSWKVAELKAYAAENGVDLGEATKKDDILAAIAQPAVPAAGTSED